MNTKNTAGQTAIENYIAIDGADGFNGLNIYSDADYTELIDQIEYAGDVTTSYDRAVAKAKAKYPGIKVLD